MIRHVFSQNLGPEDLLYRRPTPYTIFTAKRILNARNHASRLSHAGVTTYRASQSVRNSVIAFVKRQDQGAIFPAKRVSCCAMLKAKAGSNGSNSNEIRTLDMSHRSNLLNRVQVVVSGSSDTSDLSRSGNHDVLPRNTLINDLTCPEDKDFDVPMVKHVNFEGLYCPSLAQQDARNCKVIRLTMYDDKSCAATICGALVDCGATRCHIPERLATQQGWKRPTDEELDAQAAKLGPVETVQDQQMSFLGVHTIRAVVASTGQRITCKAHVVPNNEMPTTNVIIGLHVLEYYRLLTLHC